MIALNFVTHILRNLIWTFIFKLFLLWNIKLIHEHHTGTHERIYPLLGFMQKWFFFKHTKTILKNHFIERFRKYEAIIFAFFHPVQCFVWSWWDFMKKIFWNNFWYKNKLISRETVYISVIVRFYWMSFSSIISSFPLIVVTFSFKVLIFYICFHFLLLRKSFK